jgi:hypothetical protein
MLASCGREPVEDLPDNVLQREVFIPVLVDLQILESHFQRQFARIDLYRDALDSSSRFIFEDHGVTKDMFTATVNYYATQPDTLFVIYEAALDSIKFRTNANTSSEIPTVE